MNYSESQHTDPHALAVYRLSDIYLIKCLSDVSYQIVRILKSAGISDQIRIYSAGLKLRIIHLTVSSACRMQAAGTRISNMGLDCSQLHVLHKLLSCFSAALDTE